MNTKNVIANRTAHITLVGLESVGKTAVYRTLTGEICGDETNVKGSTVSVRSAVIPGLNARLYDTPGIRLASDSETTRLALRQITGSDALILVARAPVARREAGFLLNALRASLAGRRLALALTFADKLPRGAEAWAAAYGAQLGIPVALLNARRAGEMARQALLRLARTAAPLAVGWDERELPEDIGRPAPAAVFERPFVGPLAAVGTMLALFAAPVYGAYALAGWLQPLADASFVAPLKGWIAAQWGESLPTAVLAGDYGVLTLGWYSFLWAFPVVAFVGLAVAIAEETGIKDRIAAALDPVLRRVGLSGRDLIPVLTGFGCNVVAVQQSRACSACTRKSCVSMIAIGSACSYQIGASLSIFSVAGAPGLFVPYMGALFLVGALHNRIWGGALHADHAVVLPDRAFFQTPSMRAVWWRFRVMVRQFLFEAMPIFLFICAGSALLQRFGAMGALSSAAAPWLRWLGLPGEAAPGLVFSIFRKDGLLVLNQGDGAVLAAMSPAQVFLLVYLASTLTACLVTLWTVRRELGGRFALTLAGRQALTAVAGAFFMAAVMKAAGML